MSITLRGILKAAWEYNPIMLPFTLAKKFAESDAAKQAVHMAKDGIDVAAETTARAAQDLNKRANRVLDYPIDKAVNEANRVIAQEVILPTAQKVVSAGQAANEALVHTGEAIVDAHVKTGQAILHTGEAIVDAHVKTGRAIVSAGQAANEAIVEGAIETGKTVIEIKQATDQAIVDGVVGTAQAVDQAQRDARNGLADWIRAD